MKKQLLSILLVLAGPFVALAQQQLNLPFLSNWNDPNIPAAFYGPYNDCWGYVDSAGREYAILGSSTGTHFIDVTDGANPVQVSYQASKDLTTLAIHRDFKTYQHYCYGVADEGANSLQIFDLQYLPDSVVKVYDSDVLCIRAHNIFIEGDKIYLASNTVGNGFNAMDVLSLANPENPTFISSLFNPLFNHVHDVYVKNDTAYCSVGYEGFYIYSYVNPAAPQLLMSLTNYPEQGYNHSSWLAPDGNHVVVADENHGSGLKLIDISDYGNPVVTSIFRSNLLNVAIPNGPNGSIPHNEFIVGDKLFVSYYHDGVQVFDISDPSNPVQDAYYDTYIQNTDYSGYAGCWGVYPFFPSGKIIASDISNGLFVLDATAFIGTGIPDPVAATVHAFPNPFQDLLSVSIPADIQGKVTLSMDDVSGRNVFSKSFNVSGHTKLEIPTEAIAMGVYALTIDYGNNRLVSKVLKTGTATE